MKFKKHIYKGRDQFFVLFKNDRLTNQERILKTNYQKGILKVMGSKFQYTIS